MKPGNVLVARDRRRRARLPVRLRPRQAHLLGHEPHRRPEPRRHDRLHLPRADRGGTIDARADVYSLGCMLFECLTGEAPFARESELAAVYAHMHEAPPLASETRPGVPAAFDAVVATAMAKAPDDRFASCGALATARRRGAPGRGAAAPGAGAPPPRPLGAGGRGRRGRRPGGRPRPARRRRGGPGAARDPAEVARPDRRALARGRGRHPLREPALGRRVRRRAGLGAPRRRAPRGPGGHRVAQGPLDDDAPVHRRAASRRAAGAPG